MGLGHNKAGVIDAVYVNWMNNDMWGDAVSTGNAMLCKGKC